MNTKEQRSSSFVVRIWWEYGNTATPDAQPTHCVTSIWRGWVQSVRNNRQMYFQNFATLDQFIAEEIGVVPVSGEAHEEIS